MAILKYKNNTKEFLDKFKGHHIFVSMGEFNAVPIHYHSGYDKSIDALKKANENAGIFFTVNELDESRHAGKHRTKKMVIGCRALFMDDDIPIEAHRNDFPLNPSLVVKSSTNAESGLSKFHYYWLIKDVESTANEEERERWSNMQSGIVYKYGGDNNAKDITRYLRLPGFNHLKDKDNKCEVTWGGNGRRYTWLELQRAFKEIGDVVKTDSKRRVEVKEVKEAKEEAGRTLSEIEEDIISGKDFHGGILNLSYQMKQDGVPEQWAIKQIEGLMDQCSLDVKLSERWKSRRDDIGRLYREASESKGVDIDDIDFQEEIDNKRNDIGEIPWPPGLMGELCDSAYNMARYQYREVAVVSAVGLIAGIAGRKFNASGTGLNVYLTLIMGTGMGKDSIGKFIVNTLSGVNDGLSKGSSFIGKKSFTGAKAIANDLEENRSQICVFTEAGLMLDSKSGDKQGLRKELLDLYTKSGKNDYSTGAGYSDAEKTIKPIRAPALSIINEATPDLLLKVYRNSDSMESGDLPRQSVYRVSEDVPKANRECHMVKISANCISKIKQLVGKCGAVQDQDDPLAWDMVPDDDVDADMEITEEHYRTVRNAHQHEDSNLSIMASRAYLKAVKFAAIASVFNHHDARICSEEWEWGKNMVKFEMAGLDNFFSGSTGAELTDLARDVVGKAIVNILKGKYKSRFQQANAQERKRGHVPLSCVKQATRKNKDLIDLNDDVQTRSNPITGLEKVLSYMRRQGMIKDTVVSGKKLLVITDVFKTLFDAE